ncbi:phosphatidylethanolamine-binding protein 4 isoform X1 [Electrophorus electricus]|uniref:Phosphatidylethanolamine-binding protein 4 n=1 Tax=Electrophorus electricus TaxID=8005 RepID=A0A4W4DSX0_ELEEL|nr:phosphatidylethanolamine-binding protein 4 isoform X1 [Electrophorus electricus]
MNSSTICLLALACILGTHQNVRGTTTREELSLEDKDFCNGGLELRYPGLDISSCLVIPKDVRERISMEWAAPDVQLTSADQKKNYVFMMVDPDAPSRANPTRSYWRHWLLVDIKGSRLGLGDVEGTVISEYAGPTPPQGTGFHRYQFLLYEQGAGQVPKLSEQEGSSRGNWDLQAFVEKFGLVGPVASLQFLTQNYKD